MLGVADFFKGTMLDDLKAGDLMLRPVPDANHIAWQWGHLIASERRLVEAAAPGSMPELPAGFAERHTKDTATSDNPADFCTREEYERIGSEVRAGTLRALDKLSDADFDKPVSGKVPPFIKRAGDCFLTIGAHWGGHAGQWVVVRRKLGLPRKF
jgi:hypothetical protein